jgi:hypothetical protein
MIQTAPAIPTRLRAPPVNQNLIQTGPQPNTNLREQLLK